jgi:threonine dehydrogenase-like Zn-dependent dehydrogenase
LAVASHILRISGSKKGQDVVILGGGPIGLAFLLLLMPKGVRKVIVSEVSNSRSRQAKKFGADLVVNEDFEDVLKVLSHGTASAEAMITSVVPPEKAVQDGCLELINIRVGYVRILTSLQSL